ncbi:MAG: 2-oxoacid:acceptor oxidoreductase subunit alpha [Saprospiraceae bacterium]|jgi:2-oxoglutarate ferredoxin oxidoreductase subunit alpha|uniref:2-oxoacid:acceptor oxidoreductase subunit alpha n=1 Tax=Candidatus Brachybacter algidus TaxID=2982024 RepID=UPI001B667E19|nr:2-oxoacid:acceptor oxidoreductase subunit alpha [Candidatus Brachybacter algidus]MBP7304536.1 2-oxoacid:acceptor oxidoreductase subunit alpha [Saprospiraceae bacterium]MBK7603207.1 2-oxoacid:acceptor oxidoreductase subunit alpha [Candidatus Brachybacter algidus]MBK9023919.1 2-oxoacid:acceptor oxidoreductase subunit alpha [Candidatus Brachybacter algidus]MBP7538395.1 2-oxoacid:acceptor oxidoreductase subunit alpha [Saprospiraceae bacterium]MBP8890893.1 2-oxoacid:acceptor oxidoreductase subun
MSQIKVNDLVIRFANVNGTGSASANGLFAKAVYKMGVPVTPKNIFPSNIQGLPTWYEVRVSEKNYLGRRAGIDIMVAINAQSFMNDLNSVSAGGYFVYDNSGYINTDDFRQDINYVGIPMINLSVASFNNPRIHLLMKNVIYIGAIAAMLNIDLSVFEELVKEQFKKKEKLIPGNIQALSLGYDYAKANYSCPIDFTIEHRDLIGDRILAEGNDACGLGAVYAGATVGSWYPITPSTSVMSSFEKWCKKLRVDPETGRNNFAIVQAEDELAAIGMVVGANWNGARAFTATSGPGVSLMTEFLGLAYFAEIPVVLIDVQRSGPSTGMPTRSQQSDLFAAAYASHGDTKHILLFPSTPTECFDMTAMSFDLAERFQTPVIIMTDLDLGMNDHLCYPFKWDDSRRFDRGKVLTAEALDQLNEFGRYLDVDGDGVTYRTLPGTHPDKGAFFTRGSSKDEFARYTEDGQAYVRNMKRLEKKWDTIKSNVPTSDISLDPDFNKAILYFGTTIYSAEEALDILKEHDLHYNWIRIKSFPFGPEVIDFINRHEEIFVIEQNRDAQMRSLLINELEVAPSKLKKVLNYDGMAITAEQISMSIKEATIFMDHSTPEMF